MLEVFTALTGDYLAANGVALSGTAAAGASFALQRLLLGRAERARDIFIDELKRGDRTIHEIAEDEAAAITYRYFRAATEGAARINLRLMAAVVGGSEQKPGTYADDFLRWADVIASMTREELIVCGVVYRLGKGQKLSRDGNFWSGCLSELREQHGIDAEDADQFAAGLLRTGLLVILGGLMDMGHAYLPSRKLMSLGAMVDFHSVFEAEGLKF